MVITIHQGNMKLGWRVETFKNQFCQLNDEHAFANTIFFFSLFSLRLNKKLM